MPDELKIVPEYGADARVERVYTRVARAIIRGGQLELLNLCCAESRPSGMSKDLPSWVPDWRCPLPPSWCNIKQPELYKPYFSAGGPVGTLTGLADGFDADDVVLGLEGYLVDEIESVGKAWLEPTAREVKYSNDKAEAIAEQRREILGFLNEVKAMCEEAIDKRNKAGHLTLATEASLREAVWRVPCGDLADEMPGGNTQRAT